MKPVICFNYVYLMCTYESPRIFEVQLSRTIFLPARHVSPWCVDISHNDHYILYIALRCRILLEKLQGYIIQSGWKVSYLMPVVFIPIDGTLNVVSVSRAHLLLADMNRPATRNWTQSTFYNQKAYMNVEKTILKLTS